MTKEIARAGSICWQILNKPWTNGKSRFKCYQNGKIIVDSGHTAYFLFIKKFT